MIRKFWESEAGNFSVIAALSVGVIGAVAAVALESSRAQSMDKSLQDVLDNATLYAARISDQSDFKAKSTLLFNNNIARQEANIESISVEFNIDGNQIVGTASGNVPLFFAGLLNKDIMRISGKSIAQIGAATEDAPCIIALSETANPGLLFNSGANLMAPECKVQVHSTRTPAIIVNGGTNIEAEEICVAGHNIINNSGSSVPNLDTNCAVPADPFANKYPVPSSSSCDFNSGNYNSSHMTMSPGVYCGWHNFNNGGANVTFEPGLYVIRNGGWNVNGGNWSGTGVTFYYADSSKIQFNSGVEASFTAPTSGPYAGDFMTEAPNLPNSQFILNHNRGFEFEGVMYLPSRGVIFNSGSSLRSYKMNLVANSFIINSTRLGLESSQSNTSASDTKTVLLVE